MLFRSDRKSTRLNSSHTLISYAVFCLKKKSADMPAHAFVAALNDQIANEFAAAPRCAPPPQRADRQRVRRLAALRRGGVFFLMIGGPPSSPLFPHPGLFR